VRITDDEYWGTEASPVLRVVAKGSTEMREIVAFGTLANDVAAR
jgi:hypothetical protein